MNATVPTLTVPAYAKINLSLEVVGRRPDGYHELVSVMQTVSLADTLHLRVAPDLEITSDSPALCGPRNLVTQAAVLASEIWPSTSQTSIELGKRIPIAAGLGGGSSDAATTLIGLNRLWSIDATCADLLSLAAQLGSDVPFFLYGGTALVEGRGERVTALAVPAVRWYLLVNPGISVSTADVFRELRPNEWSDGAETHGLAASLATADAGSLGANALQAPLFRIAPEARSCFDTVWAVAPGDTMVTGSGATVVAAFESREGAEDARASMKGTGYWTAVVSSITPARENTPCRSD